jgi:hypothetical protein
MFKLIKRFAKQLKSRRRMHPPQAEEDLGGGDILFSPRTSLNRRRPAS